MHVKRKEIFKVGGSLLDQLVQKFDHDSIESDNLTASELGSCVGYYLMIAFNNCMSERVLGAAELAQFESAFADGLNAGIGEYSGRYGMPVYLHGRPHMYHGKPAD